MDTSRLVNALNGLELKAAGDLSLIDRTTSRPRPTASRAARRPRRPSTVM
ncbi:MAG: hypothetical protein ACLTKG_00040 [Collinsella intestinalis]